MNERLIADTLNEEKINREASVALFNTLGPKHVATARAWVNLADTLSAKGEDKESAELYAKALPIIEKHYHDKLFNVEELHILNKLAAMHLDDDNEVATTSFFLRYFNRVEESFDTLIDEYQNQQQMDPDMLFPISDIDVGLEKSASIMLLANQLLSKLIIMAIMYFPTDSVYYDKAVDDFLIHFDIFDMLSIDSAFAVNSDVVRYLMRRKEYQDAFNITFRLVTSYLYFTVENAKELLEYLFFLNSCDVDVPLEIQAKVEAMARSFHRRRKPWTMESIGDFIDKFLGLDD